MPLLTLTMETLEKQHKTEGTNEIDMNSLVIKKAIGRIFLGEEQDILIYYRTLTCIDRELKKILPTESYKLIKKENDKLSYDVVEEIKRRLFPIIISEIDIPILTESQKEKIVMVAMDIQFKSIFKRDMAERNLNKIETSIHN